MRVESLKQSDVFPVADRKDYDRHMKDSLWFLEISNCVIKQIFENHDENENIMYAFFDRQGYLLKLYGKDHAVQAAKQTGLCEGTILSCYTFAGAAVNMVISPVMKICGKKSIAAMCVLVVVGTAICLFIPAVPAMIVGVILAMLQFGIFISTYFIVGCHAIFQRATDIESAWMGCLIIYAVMAVFAFVVKVAPED